MVYLKSFSQLSRLRALNPSIKEGWLQVLAVSFIVLVPLLVLMVTRVIRRGAGNGGRSARGKATANEASGSNKKKDKETSSRGGRGRGKGGRRGGRGRGNDTMVEDNDDDEGDVRFSALDDYFERADRSVSTGDFTCIPKDGEPKKGVVEFTDKYINSAKQKKTLKAIVRVFWPTGPIDSIGKPRSAFFDDQFYTKVLDTFEKYYDYEQRISKAEARAKIKDHLKANLKNLLYNEKKRANLRVLTAPTGTTLRDVKPIHLNRAVWDALCDWWDTPKFKAMSAQNRDNRSHGKVLHTTGAKPYIIFRKELEDEVGHQLTLVEYFEATNQKKGAAKGTFWTEETTKTRDLLINSWNEYRKSSLVDGETGGEGNAGNSPPLSPSQHTPVELSPNKRRRVEAELVCKALKGPKKNRVFMEGRSTFSEILGHDAPALSQLFKSRKEPARLPDELLQHAIGDAACIFHSRDGDNETVTRSALNSEIEQLAKVTISKDDVNWTEYIHVTSSVVNKMFDKFGKMINEDLDQPFSDEEI